LHCIVLHSAADEDLATRKDLCINNGRGRAPWDPFCVRKVIDISAAMHFEHVSCFGLGYRRAFLSIDFQWHHSSCFIMLHFVLGAEADLSCVSQALQAAVQKIHTYVATLEGKVEAMGKK